MSTTYFGFGLAPSMLPDTCVVRRRPLTRDEVAVVIEAGVTSCLNPSHKATISVMQQRFALDVEIPEHAPRVSLGSGDSLIVLGVRGLPRLEGRHEYTDEEVEEAQFSFSLFEVE